MTARRISTVSETRADQAAETRAVFLTWIADRLVYVYGESPNVDFVLRLREEAKRTLQDRASLSQEVRNRFHADTLPLKRKLDANKIKITGLKHRVKRLQRVADAAQLVMDLLPQWPATRGAVALAELHEALEALKETRWLEDEDE